MYVIAPILLSTLLLLSIMERVNFNYSMKNIPIPNSRQYTKRLIEKTENVIKRMRWKAFFYLHPEAKPVQKENYGFNSRATPPQINEMSKFEDDLLRLIENIEFRNNRCQFQYKLNDDVNFIRRSNYMFIPADKTNNYYKLQKNEYEKLLKDNTTAKYSRASSSEIEDINSEAKIIAEKVQLADRIETIAQKPAFITIKDHKDNFPNRVQCRLINPAKSEIGVISKNILDRINKELIKTTGVQQWKNTQCAINWFKSVQSKENCSFMTFDVVEFYPSITQKLLDDALKFASDFVNISNSEKHIVHHARKTLLFHDDSPWHKSNPPYLFDVTMGSFDGAETCELVGIYLLHKIKHLFNNEVGLYRDDGLAILRNLNPSQAERLTKRLIAEFKAHNLKITVDHSTKTINFLDVTFNLNNGTYRPYAKPNSTTKYVNIKSNHPPNVTKTIPVSVNKRLSNISSSKQQFNAARHPYQEALKDAGYEHKLEYSQATTSQKKRSRNRSIIWYNPPFSKSVSTNVGKKFLNLIDKHFPRDSRLHKIFNRNSIKVSYSCMENMSRIIDAHNKSILQKPAATPAKTCNCRNPAECPLNGKCLAKCIVYQATVKSSQDGNNKEKVYIGASDSVFKNRWNNHMSSFRHHSKKSQTALSKHVWHLKENNTDFTISWSILKNTNSYSNVTKRCQLCLWEKFYIIS